MTGAHGVIQTGRPYSPTAEEIAEWRLLSAMVATVLFAAGAWWLYVLGTTVSNDAGEYEMIWSLMHDQPMTQRRLLVRYEPLSLVILWSLAQVLSAAAMFYVLGLTAFSAKFFLFRKYAIYPTAAVVVYVGLFMAAHDANQVRLALASPLILYAFFRPLSTRKLLLVAVLATLIHYSAAVIALLCLRRRPVLAFAALATASVLLTFLLVRIDLLRFLTTYVIGTGSQVSLTNPGFLLQSVIGLVSMSEWKRLSEAQQKGALFVAGGAMTYVILMSNGLLAHRLREMMMLGVMPLLFAGRVRLTYGFALIWVCVALIFAFETSVIVSELLGLPALSW